MNSALAPSFLTQFAQLPADVQALARRSYRLWKSNPAHPGLHFKRVGKRTDSWSVRIGIGWRALGVRSGDSMVWFWIGSHAEYDRIVTSL